MSPLAVCLQGIEVVKEKVGAVASCRGLPESRRNEGRGRGYHELMCPVKRRQKRKERGEVLRAVLGCQMRGMKGLSQSAGICQGCLGLRGEGLPRTVYSRREVTEIRELGATSCKKMP